MPLIEVIARDADTSYDVLRIAEALAADGRDEEALDWARRGLDKYGPDSRLRSLAARCHLHLGRRDSALELLWANFEQRPIAGDIPTTPRGGRRRIQAVA
jgi:thioredoxin-like negative regulator of GroEL